MICNTTIGSREYIKLDEMRPAKVTCAEVGFSGCAEIKLSVGTRMILPNIREGFHASERRVTIMVRGSTISIAAVMEVKMMTSATNL